jgi:hypothetical protein
MEVYKMTLRTTGLIENSPVSGIRPNQQMSVQIMNRNASHFSSVLIQGFHGTERKPYILKTIEIPPQQSKCLNFYAEFDMLFFEFNVLNEMEENVEITLWGKNSDGLLTMQHPVFSELTNQLVQQVQEQNGCRKTFGFGSLYGSDEEQPLNGRFETIEFDETGPAVNAAPALLTNLLSVSENGMYEITAQLTLLLDTREYSVQGASFELFRGNQFLPGSRFDLYISEPETKLITTIGKTIQCKLSAEDAISIRVSAALNQPYYRSGSLTIKRLY